MLQKPTQPHTTLVVCQEHRDIMLDSPRFKNDRGLNTVFRLLLPFRLFNRPKLSTFNAVKNLNSERLASSTNVGYEPKELGKSENRSQYSAYKHNLVSKISGRPNQNFLVTSDSRKVYYW